VQETYHGIGERSSGCTVRTASEVADNITLAVNEIESKIPKENAGETCKKVEKDHPLSAAQGHRDQNQTLCHNAPGPCRLLSR
jgi:hypothetical protein